MKKNIYSLLILGVFIGGCTSDYYYDPKNVKKELVPVTLDLNFVTTESPLRSDLKSDDIYGLYLAIYDEADKSVPCVPYKNLRFASNDYPEFELPEGDYMFVFVGYKGHVEAYSPPLTVTSLFLYANMMLPEGNDVFLDRVLYSVKKNKENKISATLTRIVGKIEVVIDDFIPEEVKSIDLAIDKHAKSAFISRSKVYNNGGSDKVLSFEISESDRSEKGYKMSFYAYDNINSQDVEYPVNLTITSRRGNKSIFSEKKINDVDIVVNKIIRYTGKLYDDSNPDPGPDPSPSFSITIQDKWDDPEDRVF